MKEDYTEKPKDSAESQEKDESRTLRNLGK